MAELPSRSRPVSHRKYFINCTNPQTDFTNLYRLPVESQHIIISAIFSAQPNAPKQVVVKLYASYEVEVATKEYNISERLREFPGFMRYICKVTCADDITKYNGRITPVTRLCTEPKSPETTILVSKYYKYGAMKSADWRELGIHALRSCIMQVFAIALDAYMRTGFLHQDLHSSNVLLRKTRKQAMHSGELGQIPLHGYAVDLVDLELSRFDGSTEQLLWDLGGFVYDMQLPNGANMHYVHGLSKLRNTINKYMDKPQLNIRRFWKHVKSDIEELSF
jgi:hypothetical protein